MGATNRISASSRSRAVCEILEQRQLLSATYEMGDLSSARVGDQIEVVWNGVTTPVVAGEWIVGMTGDQEPVLDEDGLIQNDALVHKRAGTTVAAGIRDAVVTAHMGLEAVAHIGMFNSFLLRAPTSVPYQALLQIVSKIPGFRYLEPSFVDHAQAIPNDSYFDQQWGLNNTGQSTWVAVGKIKIGSAAGTPDADIDAPEAWDITTGNENVVVAVFDSGVNYNHVDLIANRYSKSGEIFGNGIDDDGDTYVDNTYGWDFVSGDNLPLDDFGHGTNVAGVLAAAGNNNQLMSGVTWNTRFMSIKIADSSGSAAPVPFANAVDYVIGQKSRGVNVRVINYSYGGNSFSQTRYDAIQRAMQSDILFVTGAGNANIDVDKNGYPTVFPVGFDLDNIVGVAATDRNDQRAGFSNWGAVSVDIAAPGDDLRTTEWDSMDNTKWAVVDGTSVAAPMVAGVAALLLSIKPDASYLAVKNAMIESGSDDDLVSMANLVVSGGRVNAYKAVLDMRSSSGIQRTIIGDENAVPADDEYEVVVKPGDSTKTLVRKKDASGQFIQVASLTNAVSQKIGIFTFDGNDTITVGPGVTNNIYVNAGAGNDVIELGEGNDYVNGGVGNDVLRGGAGSDQLYGNGNNDQLFGEDGNDYLRGDALRDTLLGGNGVDDLAGGSDNDLLDGGADGDTINGGPGDDIVDYRASTSGVTVTIGDGLFNDGTSGEGDNVDGTVEVVWGSAYGDTLSGSANADTLVGNGGDDLLYGFGGDDMLFGDMNSSTMIGVPGRDTMYGYDGNDLLYSRIYPNATKSTTDIDDVYGGNGTDTAQRDDVDNVYWVENYMA